MLDFLRDLKLNIKVSLLGAGSVLATAVALVALAVWQSGQYNTLAQSEVDGLIDADLDHITQGVYNLVQTENEAVQQQVNYNLNVARHVLDKTGGITISKETATWTAVNQFTNKPARIQLPRMLAGGQWLGQNTRFDIEIPVVDVVMKLVGETATIFQRMNDNGDMLRVATTVKTSEGRRAIGTYIPAVNPDGTPNPVIAAVLTGKTYHGRAFVVNAWYLTAYEPLKDKAGRLVGMLYVGIKQKAIEARVHQAILQTKVGKTGYVYVLGGKGEERGHYIISQNGQRDGEDIWENKDSDGHYVIQTIINKAIVLRSGEVATEYYRWQNPGDSEPRWKIARLVYFEPWDWVIGTSVYMDELQNYRAVLNRGRVQMIIIMGIAGLGITLFIGFLGILIAWTIGRPIQRMKGAVETIIQGNLNQVLDIHSRDEIGALAQTFNIMTDRLRQTMEGLTKSEEKYRRIVDTAHEGIWSIDEDLRTDFVNVHMAEMLGYQITGMIGQKIDCFTFEEDLPDHTNGMGTRRQEVPEQYERRWRHRNGHAVWTIVSETPVFDAGHHYSGSFAMLTDITGRKQNEATIRAAKERFSSVLRAATAYSIIGTDPDGIIKVFNEGAEMMLGYRADEVIDKANIDIIHDAVEVAARTSEMEIKSGIQVFGLAATQGKTETREWTYIRKNGSRLTVSLTVSAMRSEAGLLTGFIGIARDITDEKKLEQQFLQSQKMETVGLLAGGIAHDFNNLLTPIIGYTEMLIASYPTGDSRRVKLEQVMRAAERAAELTHQLLTFSRKQMIALQTVALSDVIYRFENMLRRTLRENIKIEFRISPTLGLVQADEGQLEQVLMNLSINAQDAMPEGGTLTIEAMDITLDESYTASHPEIIPGPYVMLSVIDTGGGINEQSMDHIFEPFYTTKELGKGTGLGLSTVYGIIKKHGGSISVYSEKTRGTIFNIFLPRVIQDGVAVEKHPPPQNETAHGNETVLVVEDNEMVRSLACDMLRSRGYEVFVAEKPEQCIALIQIDKVAINLLLTDVVMPKMNGKELYELLRIMTPKLKVLFMSGYPSDVIGHHGVLDEGVNFLQKPFSIHDLLKKVRHALDS